MFEVIWEVGEDYGSLSPSLPFSVACDMVLENHPLFFFSLVHVAWAQGLLRCEVHSGDLGVPFLLRCEVHSGDLGVPFLSRGFPCYGIYILYTDVWPL